MGHRPQVIHFSAQYTLVLKVEVEQVHKNVAIIGVGRTTYEPHKLGQIRDFSIVPE